MARLYEMDDLVDQIGIICDKKLHPDVTVNSIMIKIEDHIKRHVIVCMECEASHMDYEAHDADCELNNVKLAHPWYDSGVVGGKEQ